MKRIMVVGLLAALLTTALGQWVRARVTADATIDEGAQLGSAYPEVMQWPDLSADATIDEGAQLGSAYPEVMQWPDLSADAGIDEGAQLGSAYPEITHWPEPVIQVSAPLRISLGRRVTRIPPKEFSVVTPEDIEKLWQVGFERGERPSHEGHLSLEFKPGRLRQYVTLTLARALFGSFVAIERIDFIQEQWQVNVLHQDEIDQWVVSANADGTARHVWHKRLLEDKGNVLKEEFLPTDEDSTQAIVEKIAARFLPSNRVPPMLGVTAIMPTADRPQWARLARGGVRRFKPRFSF